MKIETLTAARISLFGWGFPEFSILIVPGAIRDGQAVMDCYLEKMDCGTHWYMFGMYGSLEEVAEIAYKAVPDYLPSFIEELQEEE